MHRRNILDSRLSAGDKEDLGKSGKSGEKASEIIQQTREEFGRYFGICSSYHHLKACTCKNCPSYSGGAGWKKEYYKKSRKASKRFIKGQDSIMSTVRP